MAAVTICSDFGAQKNKVWHCFHCFPIYFPWSGGTGCLKTTRYHFTLLLVAKSCPTLLWPHGLQHTRLPCPSPSPGVCSNLCPLSGWCHPTISSSVILFSSCLQSFPAQRSFPKSQFFISAGQTIGASALKSVHHIFRCNAVVDFIDYSTI